MVIEVLVNSYLQMFVKQPYKSVTSKAWHYYFLVKGFASKCRLQRNKFDHGETKNWITSQSLKKPKTTLRKFFGYYPNFL